MRVDLAEQYSILTFLTYNDVEIGQMDKMVHGVRRFNGFYSLTVVTATLNYNTTTHALESIDLQC
jgi:hypothetical protein